MESKLLDKLNRNTAYAWSIDYNEHKTCHTTTVKEIQNLREQEVGPDQLSIEEEKRCIELDTIYWFAWYPETSLGSYHLYAPTYEELLVKIDKLIDRYILNGGNL